MTQTQTSPHRPHPAFTPHFWRISVAMYHELIADGKLTANDRVELLDGFLVQKMAQNDPHAKAVERLTPALYRLVPAGYRPRVQLPVTLEESEPEPDGAVIRGNLNSAPARHPVAGEICVVIEIADSSLDIDREGKAQIYARDNLPVYWIVNLVDRQVEVLTDPDPAARSYRSTTIYKPDDSLPLVLDGVTVASIPVNDLLP